MIENTCRLQGLSRWTPENHLAGLIVEENSLLIDRRYFDCCDARGQRVISQPNLDSPLGYVAFCELTRRIFWLSELAKAAEVRFDAHGMGAASLKSIETLRADNSDQFTHSDKGRLLNLSQDVHVEAIWLSFLASLVWHDGVQILLYRHGLSSRRPPPTTAWTQSLQKAYRGYDSNSVTGRPGKSCIVLTDVDGLWDGQRLSDFEQVVSFASQTMTPLWIIPKVEHQVSSSLEEKPTTHGASQAPTLKFGSALKQRVQTRKRRPLKNWLTSQCLHQLVEVCQL